MDLSSDDGENAEDEFTGSTFYEACEESQFVDYSCATEWESFIQDLEQALQAWDLAETDHAPHFAAGKETRRGNFFEYGGHLYNLSVVDTPLTSSKKEERPWDMSLFLSCSLALEDRSFDFLGFPFLKGAMDSSSFKAELFSSWFGLHQFILLSRAEHSSNGSSPQVKASPRSDSNPNKKPEEVQIRSQDTLKHMLLSSAIIAASNVNCSIPILLVDSFQGVASSFVDFGPTNVEGYCCPGSNRMISCILKSETIKLPSAAFFYLSGLLSLFRSKLPWPCEENKTPVIISAHHTWILGKKAKDSSWQQKAESWRRGRGKHSSSVFRGSKRSAIIQRRIEEMIGYSGSRKKNLLWGTREDPLRHLSFSITWENLKEGIVEDRQGFTNLSPFCSTTLLRASEKWKASAQWDDETAVMNSLQVAPRLRRILAAVILSHALGPHCPLQSLSPFPSMRGSRAAADLQIKQNNKIPKLNPMEKETLRTALLIGNILSEETQAEIKKLANSTTVPHPDWIDNTIDEILRKAEHRRSTNLSRMSSASFASERSFSVSPKRLGQSFSDTEALVANSEEVCLDSDRTLWLWYEHAAPVGGLLSVLSLRTASAENLATMSAMWLNFVAEVRWNTEESNFISRMLPFTDIDGYDMFDPLMNGQSQNPALMSRHGLPSFGMDLCENDFDHPDPDVRQCLLHQKLQLLNVCIEQQRLEKLKEAKLHLNHENSNRQGNAELGDSGTAPGTLSIDCTGHGGRSGSDEDYETPKKSLLGTMSMWLSSTMASPIDENSCTQGAIHIPKLFRVAPVTQDLLLQHEQVVAQVKKRDEEASLKVERKPAMATLYADMTAYRKLNPCSTFSDFVAWYSPYEWTEDTEFEEDRCSESSNLPIAMPVLQPNVNHKILSAMETTPQRLFQPPTHVRKPSQTVQERLASFRLSPHGPDLDGLTRNLEARYKIAKQKDEWECAWQNITKLMSTKKNDMSTSQLFRPDWEAEKALDYLDNMTPKDLFVELLKVLLSTSHFVLYHAVLEVHHIPTVAQALEDLDKICTDAIQNLNSECQCGLAMDTNAASAVSQSTLIACENAIQKFAETEVLISKAASLLQKLPKRYSFIDNLLKGDICVVEDSKDKQSLTDFLMDVTGQEKERSEFCLFGGREHTADEVKEEAESSTLVIQPSIKNYVFRCRTPSPFHRCDTSTSYEWNNEDENLSLSNRMNAQTDGALLRISLAVCESEY